MNSPYAMLPVVCLMKCHPYCAAGAVAEMTGRRGRVVADAKGRGVYELRAKPDSTEMDSLNVSETGIRVVFGADQFLYQLTAASW